jgi:arsenate reductase-like glutaredoxin family protein
METIIIESEGKTSEKIKAFLKEINVSFKTKTIKKDKPYDPEFVKMVLEAREGPSIPYSDELKKELFGK